MLSLRFSGLTRTIKNTASNPYFPLCWVRKKGLLEKCQFVSGSGMSESIRSKMSLRVYGDLIYLHYCSFALFPCASQDNLLIEVDRILAGNILYQWKIFRNYLGKLSLKMHYAKYLLKKEKREVLPLFSRGLIRLFFAV